MLKIYYLNIYYTIIYYIYYGFFRVWKIIFLLFSIFGNEVGWDSLRQPKIYIKHIKYIKYLVRMLPIR